MEIKKQSEIVLRELYNEFNEKSSTLMLQVNLSSIAQKLNISLENVNLCLGYLNDKELIKCDPVFFTSSNKKDIAIKATGIDLIESKI